MEFLQHGYGLLDITRARIVAELWYTLIRAPSAEQTFGVGLTLRRGSNRWAERLRSKPTAP